MSDKYEEAVKWLRGGKTQLIRKKNEKSLNTLKKLFGNIMI